METLLTALSFYMLDRPRLNLDDPLLAQLQQAIEQRNVVHLSYHALNTNHVSERDVEPLRLDYIDNAWQLRAHCRLKDDQRYFRLDRIDRLTCTSEIFAPRTLTAASPPANSWHVVVRFDTSIIRWVREEQHFSFVCEIQDENTSSLKMVYRVSSFQKILGWLLHWGDQMEVLEPHELRTLIAQTAARLMTRHQAAAESIQSSG
jgi:predicted DNA-binding transcriptional regulator YafY